MYNSVRLLSRSEQSASLPGRVIDSSADLRMTRSRALRAASRARAEVRHLLTIALAAAGFSSMKRANDFAYHLGDGSLHFGVHQLDFGLRLRTAGLGS